LSALSKYAKEDETSPSRKDCIPLRMSVRGDSASISVNEVMDDANVVARGSMLRLKLSLGKKPSER
jgi:hypothetical protein